MLYGEAACGLLRAYTWYTGCFGRARRGERVRCIRGTQSAVRASPVRRASAVYVVYVDQLLCAVPRAALCGDSVLYGEAACGLWRAYTWYTGCFGRARRVERVRGIPGIPGILGIGFRL